MKNTVTSRTIGLTNISRSEILHTKIPIPKSISNDTIMNIENENYHSNKRKRSNNNDSIHLSELLDGETKFGRNNGDQLSKYSTSSSNQLTSESNLHNNETDDVKVSVNCSTTTTGDKILNKEQQLKNIKISSSKGGREQSNKEIYEMWKKNAANKKRSISN